MNISKDKKTYKPLYGIYQKECKSEGAAELRERVHGVHFFAEDIFEEGAILERSKSGLIRWNWDLITDYEKLKTIYETYPLIDEQEREGALASIQNDIKK